MIEVARRIYYFADVLPVAPERICFYAGMFGLANGMYDIEFGNSIVGGTLAVLGTMAIGASTNTESARDALDNRGNS